MNVTNWCNCTRNRFCNKLKYPNHSRSSLFFNALACFHENKTTISSCFLKIGIVFHLEFWHLSMVSAEGEYSRVYLGQRNTPWDWNSNLSESYWSGWAEIQQRKKISLCLFTTDHLFFYKTLLRLVVCISEKANWEINRRYLVLGSKMLIRTCVLCTLTLLNWLQRLCQCSNVFFISFLYTK